MERSETGQKPFARSFAGSLVVTVDTQLLLHSGTMRSTDIADVMIIENRNYEFPWTEGIFRDCLKAGYQSFVLRLDLQLVGYAVMQIVTDEAHILNICIDRKFNHRGYARFLLARLEEAASDEGVRMVFLEARPSNPRAINLYQRAGFNEIGNRKAYYESFDGREDAIVMAKSIVC